MHQAHHHLLGVRREVVLVLASHQFDLEICQLVRCDGSDVLRMEIHVLA